MILDTNPNRKTNNGFTIHPLHPPFSPPINHTHNIPPSNLSPPPPCPPFHNNHHHIPRTPTPILPSHTLPSPALKTPRRPPIARSRTFILNPSTNNIRRTNTHPLPPLHPPPTTHLDLKRKGYPPPPPPPSRPTTPLHNRPPPRPPLPPHRRRHPASPLPHAARPTRNHPPPQPRQYARIARLHPRRRRGGADE